MSKFLKVYCTFHRDMHDRVCCRPGSSAIFGNYDRDYGRFQERNKSADRIGYLCDSVKDCKRLAVGDSILYQGDSKAYRYMITETDKENQYF